MDKLNIKKNRASVCVFCGSSFGNDPAYREAARAMGAGIAKMGFSLVFGGGGLGLMGDVAKAVLDGEINPGKVFDLTVNLDDIAEGYAAMDERRAIKTLVKVSELA